MDPKAHPNHELYLQALKRMTPAQRADKFFELSEQAKRFFVHGLRKRFPNLPEPEFHALMLSRLAECHNWNY